MWTQLQINKMYANLYVMLIGPPGVGKTQALAPMSQFLRKSTAVTLAPTDMSKQGLLDALAEAARGALIDGRPFDYHFMALHISELSNFMSKYDAELAGLLTDLFDCPPFSEEKKRSGAGKFINNPGLSFIIGTATKNLGSTITDDMWGSGFMARVVLVFSAEDVKTGDIFEPLPLNEALGDQIVDGLRRIGEMKGPMGWEREARDLLLHFKDHQKVGAPLHNRLENYVTRRWMHLCKLCMIAALSDERTIVYPEDFHLAKSWLLEAEHFMPEIFKDMVHHEDGQIYEEMRSQFFALYMRSPDPVPAQHLYQFLAKRVGNHSVERMIQIAVAADYFRRVAGTEGNDALYIPQPSYGIKPLSTL